MSGNEEISQQDLDRMAAFLERQQDLIDATIQQLYPDLPDWAPIPKIEQARRIIQTLLNDGFTPELIAQFVDDEMAERLQVPGMARDSVAFIHSINELAHIQFALSLGDIEGLRLLGGEKAVLGQSMSKGGTSKLGKEYEPKASIRIICSKIDSCDFETVLGFLRDAERCADLYESTINPIGVQFIGVDDEAAKVEYLKRGQLPNNPKSITFCTLRNYLSQINNS
jgi:hypothetical protein